VVGAATVSREQAAAMAELSQALERSDAVSAELGERARRASQSGTEQRAAMHEVATTAQELSAVADRLRIAISRFAVDEAPVVAEVPVPVAYPLPLTVPETPAPESQPSRRATGRQRHLRRVS
jgi:hypothetical protein